MKKVIKGEKISVEVFEHLTIEVVINEERDSYDFKTPKGWGGRHYYAICQYVDDAIQVQYPLIHQEIYHNIRTK